MSRVEVHHSDVIGSKEVHDTSSLIELVTPKVLRSRSRTRSHSLGLRVLSPLLLLLLWWALARANWLPTGSLPTPYAVVKTFGTLFSHDLWGQIGDSLLLAGFGLSIGVTLGFALGLMSGLSRIGEELFDAPLQMLRTIPFLALIPLFVVWMGIGELPKVALISLATTFPMYINTAAAMRNVDRKVVEAARSYGLRGIPLVREVIFPLSLPGLLTGLRFSLGISVLALVGAETIASTGGIGYLINQAQQFQQTNIVFCGVIIYAALGLSADLLVRVIEKLALPWRAGVSVR
ncbi:MAG: transporter permease subunit [Acidimicrobiaceae bacterium]|nr:transporter permease subunit [Acidimicrobiaceae bacterium]